MLIEKKTTARMENHTAASAVPSYLDAVSHTPAMNKTVSASTITVPVMYMK